MLTNLCKDKKRFLFVLWLIITLVISCTAFLNVQMDDEEYFDLYDFEEIPEQCDGLNGVVTVREDMGIAAGTVISKLAPMHLRGGNYTMEISHESDRDFTLKLSDGKRVLKEETLKAGETDTAVSVSFPDDVYNLKAEFIYPGEGTVTLKHVFLRTSGVFYTDTIIYAVLLILIAALLCFLAEKHKIYEMEDKRRFIFIALVFFAFIICYPMYSHYIQGGTDFDHHLSRIENIRKELLRGRFPVVFYPEVFNGRGGLGALYPGVFLYIPAFLRILGMSVPGAFKVFEVLITLTSMYIGWYCLKRITGNETAAFMGSLLITLMPYRILVMFFRDAIGEAQAVIFIPLIIAGLYDCLLGDKERWPALAFGVSATAACHTLTVGFAGILCIVIALINIKAVFTENRYLSLIKAVLLFLALSAITLVPFVYYYGSDIDMIKWLAVRDFSAASLIPAQLFMVMSGMGSHSTNGLSKGIVGEDAMSLGFMGLIFILLLIFDLTKKRERTKPEIFAYGLFGLSCLFNFMSTSVFPWATLEKIEAINNVVRMIQFPTRFQSVGLTLLVISGIIILCLSDTFKSKRETVILVVIILSTVQAFSMMDSFLTGNTHMTTKFTADLENEFLNDYVPYGFEKHGFKDLPESDDAELVSFERYDVTSRVTFAPGKETEVRMPLVIFKGYKAFDENGNELPLYKGEYGEVCVVLPESDNDRSFTVEFRIPWYFTPAGILSVVTLILITAWCVIKKNRAGKAVS